ncbi:5659_t:CDS:2 [Paraglomus occultum]|uniref:5659_t:CDS:1 n=1 Tax=Paraglomus occultum TaxID=144539 RepID=A0A9N9CL20_9GLOM|nr:5659_t:CDS:2 [Paraglomus occultum]
MSEFDDDTVQYLDPDIDFALLDDDSSLLTESEKPLSVSVSLDPTDEESNYEDTFYDNPVHMQNPASEYIRSITMLSPVIEEEMEIDWLTTEIETYDNMEHSSMMSESYTPSAIDDFDISDTVTGDIDKESQCIILDIIDGKLTHCEKKVDTSAKRTLKQMFRIWEIDSDSARPLFQEDKSSQSSTFSFGVCSSHFNFDKKLLHPPKQRLKDSRLRKVGYTDESVYFAMILSSVPFRSAACKIDGDGDFTTFRYTLWLPLNDTEPEDTEDTYIQKFTQDSVYFITGKFTMLENGLLELVVSSCRELPINKDEIPVCKPIVFLG